MDPNETLRQIAWAWFLSDDDEMKELAASLHAWITNGGFAPDWAKNAGGTYVYNNILGYSHLDNMTGEKWKSMTEAERDLLRDRSHLTPQLCGLEGWLVEIETDYGETRRFIVGRSSGWRPIHLEISNRRSIGGVGAMKTYKSVKRLYKAY